MQLRSLIERLLVLLVLLFLVLVLALLLLPLLLLLQVLFAGSEDEVRDFLILHSSSAEDPIDLTTTPGGWWTNDCMGSRWAWWSKSGMGSKWMVASYTSVSRS